MSIVERYKPLFISLAAWGVGMLGYFLPVNGYETIGGLLAVLGVLIFPYAFYLAYIQIKNRPG